MNDNNPFIPQGSLLEQKNKKRARVKFAVLAIFAVNIILISPLLLIQACKRGDQSAQNDQDNTTNTTPPDTGMALNTTNPAALGSPSNTGVATASNVITQTPVPPVPPVRPTVSDTTEYVVLAHDTYTSIAKKFPGLSVKALEAANPDVPPTKLMPGKSIKVPPTTGPMGLAVGVSDSDNIYIVKSGDYLITIAHKYNTTVKALQDLNDLKSTQIKAGQKLKVPVKAAATTAAAPDAAPAATTTASNPMTPASMIH